MAVGLPDDGQLQVAVKAAHRLASGEAEAMVIKDGGDDPDVTHGAHIVARVTLAAAADGGGEIAIRGGEGVGVATRPGLPVAPGEPAINPVPRQMIRSSLREALAVAGRDPATVRLTVTIEVPGGERLALSTLNPRLGILGGISILGTHGLVKPFSHEGYTGAIDSALKVAAAAGTREVVLTTGGKSERHAMALCPDLPALAFVQMADYHAHALGRAAGAGFARVGLVAFFGKAVKQAQGLGNTHARRAPLDLPLLAAGLAAAGADGGLSRAVAGANTARHVLEILAAAGRLDLVAPVGRRMLASARRLAGPGPKLWVAILDYQGRPLYQGGGREAA